MEGQAKWNGDSNPMRWERLNVCPDCRIGFELECQQCPECGRNGLLKVKRQVDVYHQWRVDEVT